jgi:hypothetical protein
MVSKSFYVRNGLVVGAASVDATTGNITTTGTLAASTATFTGVVTAPTPATTDNSTQLATTAFVQTAVSSAGGVSVTSSATAPSSPKVGDEWYDTTTGTLYQYISDGTASYWIDINGPTANIRSLSSTVIAGGSIDGTTIGGTAPAAATFTNLSYTGTLTGSTGVVNIGAGQIYKDASGNVGIGTSAPSSLGLQISKGAGVSAGLLLSNTTNNWSIGCGASSNFLSFTDNQFSERARIDSTGNLTVGTTFGNAAQGNIDIANSSSGLSTASLHLGYSAASFYGSRIVNVNTPSSTAAGLFKIQQGTVSSWRDDLVIDNSGNLLIGSSAQLNTEKFRVESSSSVACSFRTTRNISGDTCIYLESGSNTRNTSSYLINGSTTTVGVTFAVYGNGNVVNLNNSYGAISDIKLKENITDATPKLAQLNKVRIVNYNLKTDPNHKQLGVIAQELEQIFPGMVEESPDREQQTKTREVEVPEIEEVQDSYGNVITKASPASTRTEEYTEQVELGTVTKSVKYSVFVPMLIKSLQEQQVMIDALTSRITAMENK